MKDKINKINNLIYILNEATIEYEEGHSPYSDKEWDDMYFELLRLEKETGYISTDSPTQKIHYAKISELKKIKHNHPMLSLDKTKDLKEIENFLHDQPFVAMFKMDGITCSLTYENGNLVRAETRGNGIEGENIFHNIIAIRNIPLTIPYKDRLVVDGEIICRKDDFEDFQKDYKNPRNFAAGSIRLLDSKECSKRKLTFVAWDLIEGYPEFNEFWMRLAKLKFLGFIIVPYTIQKKTPEEAIEALKTQCYEELLIYPTDGFVFKFNDIEYGKAQGQTEHHFKNAIALKEYDELYDTRLKYIMWTMGRTGVLTPVAVFDPIDIDGSTIERASLHNVSIMKEILGDCAYVGEPLKVMKANQIIPQIAEAGPKYDYGYIVSHGGVSANDVIERCPICGGDISYVTSEDGVINIYCDNPFCEGKLINRLEHFFGKKGLNIKGLSKATFEKLINWDFISNIEDVFYLQKYRDTWIKKSGFNVVSVDKALNAIEQGKNTTLAAFLSAIGIPLVGVTIAKKLANYFKTYEDFRDAVMNDTYNFFTLSGFGIEIHNSIKNFDYAEADKISKILIFEKPVTNSEPIDNKNLQNMIIVITGRLQLIQNRNFLINIIEKNGGKVSSSISKKTSLLINNDILSVSSKNKKAKELNIPILSEKEFFDKYNIIY